MVLGTPVLAIAIVLVALERTIGIGVFDPNMGGDPLLFQHLFWFYSHPAVYIMILPGMGVISEIIALLFAASAYSDTRLLPSRRSPSPSSAFSCGRTTCSSWACPTTRRWSSRLLTMLVAVPSAIKVFNWSATLYKGSITFETPMLYAFGFIGLVHHRRSDRRLPRLARHGHPPHRDLLHRGALPLRHGGRHVDGVSWRASTSGGPR